MLLVSWSSPCNNKPQWRVRLAQDFLRWLPKLKNRMWHRKNNFVDEYSEEATGLSLVMVA
jgi:hypothetical protein